MDAHVEELLKRCAGAKRQWPIPDTGVVRDLRRFKAPTLVVTGDKDVVVPAAHGAAGQGHIDGAGPATLAGVRRIAAFDQSAAFARLVAGFLAGEALAAVA